MQSSSCPLLLALPHQFTEGSNWGAAATVALVPISMSTSKALGAFRPVVNTRYTSPAALRTLALNQYCGGLLPVGSRLHVEKAVACPTVNANAVLGPLLAGAQGASAPEDAVTTLEDAPVEATTLEAPMGGADVPRDPVAAPMELDEAAADCAIDEAFETSDPGVEVDADALDARSDADTVLLMADAP